MMNHSSYDYWREKVLSMYLTPMDNLIMTTLTECYNEGILSLFYLYFTIFLLSSLIYI